MRDPSASTERFLSVSLRRPTPAISVRERRALPAHRYPRRDSNARTRLRRPVLYPLSYGGMRGILIARAASHTLGGMEPWRLLVSPADRAARNLAADHAVAESVRDGAAPPTLRFYTWRPPALSLGRGQPLALVDRDLARRRGIDVVRRPTGGQAILHDDELTYAVMLPAGHPLAAGGVLASYQRLHRGFVQGFAALGLRVDRGVERPASAAAAGPLCFAATGAHELSAAGVKLLGSAQTRVDGVLLQHGSVPFRHDPAVFDLLRQPRPAPLPGLRQLLSPAPTVGALIEALAAGVADALGAALRPGALSAAERRRRDVLVRVRYACGAWTARR